MISSCTDVLLAVAARKQNEKVYEASVEQLERHIGQIESSHMWVTDREREAIDEFALTLRNTQSAHRDAHYVRMKAVLKEVNELKEAMVSATKEKSSAEDVRILRHQVEQYEQILLIYTARFQDAESMNKRLNEEKLEQAKNVESLRQRLSMAEDLIFKFVKTEKHHLEQ